LCSDGCLGLGERPGALLHAVRPFRVLRRATLSAG
jgi:hypothetical protein